MDLDAELDQHQAVLVATRAELAAPFGRLVEVCAEAVRGGHKIMLFGNGGSAGDAQHLATELTVRYVEDRRPIAALALTTDSSALTAIGNVGPGLGAIGPTENFSHLPAYVKLTLSFCMIAGRLEIFTIIVLFEPHFWKR